MDMRTCPRLLRVCRDEDASCAAVGFVSMVMGGMGGEDDQWWRS